MLSFQRRWVYLGRYQVDAVLSLRSGEIAVYKRSVPPNHFGPVRPTLDESSSQADSSECGVEEPSADRHPDSCNTSASLDQGT